MPKISQYNRDETQYFVECPGCGCTHYFNNTWQFNGDFENPTISPSILVRTFEGDKVVEICHFFIRDGKFEFCGDSTHELAGKTIDMIDI